MASSPIQKSSAKSSKGSLLMSKILMPCMHWPWLKHVVDVVVVVMLVSTDVVNVVSVAVVLV